MKQSLKMKSHVLFHRLIRRFCNMSSETVRKFKRSHQLKKSNALRQGLQANSTKKGKQLDGISSIANTITDPLPKSATRFSLKALAYKGDNVF